MKNLGEGTSVNDKADFFGCLGFNIGQIQVQPVLFPYIGMMDWAKNGFLTSALPLSNIL
ncbi:hypothetical protein [Pseudozobellia thermophila]|uniref:Uncharacterized protein n=1 Tax=Pseudozobellia thermophila TaxID=192903 RepID=A0A1M6CEJ9_9FLAO|nr:hypothetical protein [Pseudozobellia thermophila]SHI59406.1 hypothetical protein SAMN04488513_101737 [Pseudozobellia thermophila]